MLVNIMYQPGEINEKSAGVERITPVDNKLQHVKINIDLLDVKEANNKDLKKTLFILIFIINTKIFTHIVIQIWKIKSTKQHLFTIIWLIMC